MSDNADRRIQLRESIHQLVVSAANARCVSPAAFVSMVVYDYLAARNETVIAPIAAPAKTMPTKMSDARRADMARIWGDEDDDDD